MSLEVITTLSSELGEGPLYHNGDFYWIDITGKRINRLAADGSESCIVETPSFPGSAVITDEGILYSTLEDGLYRVTPGFCEAVGKFSITDPAIRFNDGKCDRRGRYWCGTMDKFNEQIPMGSLYVIDHDLSFKQILGGVTTSNGLCWNDEETRFYYVDSPTKKVFGFDYDPDSLELKNRKVVYEVEGEAFPDGMTIDREGYLWLALWNGYSVIRINPDSGKVVQTIEVPCRKATSVCFGGGELSELYITTASLGMTEEDWKKYPDSGRCFKLQTSTAGYASTEFKINQ